MRCEFVGLSILEECRKKVSDSVVIEIEAL